MSATYHGIRIGNLTLDGNLFLAPVAGFSDAPFRAICLKRGAILTFSEMISSEGIVRNNRKTLDLLTRASGERYPAIQLFGSNPDTIAAAALRILPWEPSLIDLNCGCPVPKVVKTGAGSALLKTPEEIGKIVTALRRILDNEGRQSVAVTVKIRSGWDTQTLTYADAARYAEDAGAGAITLHPRTRSQGYSGTADWKHIARLKELITIPLIGSGDLFTPEAALRMMDETGCNGVMFARGAVGNPFIFHITRKLLETGTLPAPPPMDIIRNTLMEHLGLAIEYKGERVGCQEMRKHLCAYTKGLRGGATVRRQIATASSMDEYKRIFNEMLYIQNSNE